MEKTGVIYMYVSPSNKVYIGKTVREKQRKIEHRTKTINSKTYFGKALKKYGYESFEYWVLFRFKTNKIDKLNKVLEWLERKCIQFYMSNYSEFGYNLTKGGDGVLGFKHSEETKQYLSKCSKDFMSHKEHRDALTGRPKGSIMSEKTKELLKNHPTIVAKSKQVNQYDMNNLLINNFKSISDAARSLHNDATFKTKSNRISEVCSGKSKSYQNFIWCII